MTPARAQAVRDLAVLTLHAAALVIVARWTWQQITHAARDITASVARYYDRRDALARASMPRSLP